MSDEKKEVTVTAPKGSRTSDVQKYSSPFEEMEHLFNDFVQQRFFAPSWISRFKLPDFVDLSTSVDMFEDNDDLVVKAELPGMQKDDINIEFAGDSLTISGEKKTEEKTERKDYYREERSFGSFRRKLHLPVEVKLDNTTASFKDGVLEIRMPKSDAEKQKVRKIKVK